ncbi:hypothetical protein [Actinomadura parmotrematis]|uniref:Uncharacterized protein n=1 Tax=Actinomadura parmotrematis TaxID=2864039 RepID=A0ABS7FW63_9ACTN|nr:hypothetical protein [Actinomadura parmotrematis]MBW8484561.1 hypothetical protein [Actinomadura parmotrematis]
MTGRERRFHPVYLLVFRSKSVRRTLRAVLDEIENQRYLAEEMGKLTARHDKNGRHVDAAFCKGQAVALTTIADGLESLIHEGLGVCGQWRRQTRGADPRP